MIVGVIKTRDLFSNPVEVFHIYGFKGTVRLILRAFSRKKYQFVDFFDLTARVLIGRKKG